MNARGSTEVIVATIGLSMGALSENLFTMIVAMAIITTMAMPPTLRWALARLPMRKQEKQRLEREEMEAKGFVPKLERLLLAVDDSANGKFAARLAGLIAGSGGMPTTVMSIETDQKTGKAAAEVAKEKAAEAGETVKEFAGQAGKAEQAQKPEEKPAEQKLDVTTRVEKPKTEAVAEEAKKGYDLLIIGLDKTVARKREFADDVARLAAGFEGPLAVSRRARPAPRGAAARQAQHPGAGQRHRRVAARGRGRHRAGAREPGAAHRALRQPGRQARRTQPMKRRSSRTSCSLPTPTT